MDTKNLKVGQIVHMSTDWEEAGPGARGFVTSITPEGMVYVQCGARQIDGSWNPQELLCFYSNGKGTPETNVNGPWHICHIEDLKEKV